MNDCAAFLLPPKLLALMRELGELKRVRSAGRVGSVAERLFADGWSRMLAGMTPSEAAHGNVVAWLTMTRMGDVDASVLRDLGVDEAEIEVILRGAFDQVASLLEPPIRSWLSGRRQPGSALLPDFVGRLAAQPRAGATCPGRPRLTFEPAENHAEHCSTVAAYAVLLSPVFGADPATVWVASMAHHLHNAFLPDAGFTGEILLGPHLAFVVERAKARCLAQLPLAVGAAVEAALTIIPDADTPEGRAFHAADTLDRVWQIEQHLRAGRIGLDDVLGDMALVHDGPVKSFQDAVLRSAGLA